MIARHQKENGRLLYQCILAAVCGVLVFGQLAHVGAAFYIRSGLYDVAEDFTLAIYAREFSYLVLFLVSVILLLKKKHGFLMLVAIGTYLTFLSGKMVVTGQPLELMPYGMRVILIALSAPALFFCQSTRGIGSGLYH
jgi:hypothetical protein